MYLNCHSWFSLRYGAISPRDLLGVCRANGLTIAAFTDINNTSACFEFQRMAPEFGIRAIAGIDFRNGAKQMYIGIARNAKGFRQINEHLSHYQHNQTPFSEKAPWLPDAHVIYPFSGIYQNRFLQMDLKENEWIGVSPSDIPRLRFAPEWIARKGVILQTVTFRDKKDFNIHRLLRCIDNNVLLSKLSKEEEGLQSHQMIPEAELLRYYEEFPGIIGNTEWLLDGCHLDIPIGDSAPSKNLSIYPHCREDDFDRLHRLSMEGIPYRYPELSSESDYREKFQHPVIVRIHKELDVIKEKGYVSYFLINHDITSYAREKGYFYVGRGSGANSIIAYLLRITDVDPMELDLYFERFINLYRKNPPDFDIDFSWLDRDDITRYIFNRFDHVALLGAISTFQHKAIVRELGKVFGLPKEEIDTLSDVKYNFHELDSLSRLVLEYAKAMDGFPNLLSIHAAGILISDQPIHSYTATFLPPKGYPTTHIDMVTAEDISLYKFDILSQRGLAKIRECIDIIGANQPESPPFDIHDIPRFKEDEKIKDMLRNARAIGCFYVESPAMRMLLRKLRVDDYLGLVAASSIIRPGVASSGMMREYILRHRDPIRRKNAHPILLEIMPDTYGVMVYQEDVIKVAHYYSGLSLAEADSLRRGMSGKFRGREEFDRARKSFIEKAVAKGHPQDEVLEVWRQVESFAGYAFAKGHSASYAVESYQSLFLKAHYPLEYMTATINNFGGFYSTEIYVHEARMHGASVEAPCINESGMLSVIRGKRIVLGFGLVKSLEHQTIEHILNARQKDGDFHSMEDFLERVSLSKEQMVILIRINAFRFSGRSKKELMWSAYFSMNSRTDPSPQNTLFREPVQSFSLPPLEHSWLEDAYDEIELLGFPLCDPFQLLAEEPADHLTADRLLEAKGRSVNVLGYLVTIKQTRTNKGERMYFGTFLDRNGEFLDTVHFPPVAARYPWRGKGIYSITGIVAEEFDAISIEVTEIVRLPYKEDPRHTDLELGNRAKRIN